ncbi:Uma2 family endonuclease [bacterium]|nr:Uma2 family endonuclease [bacterium]
MVKSPTKLTFEQWLTYDDGTDTCYALADGELVAMPPESFRNYDIADWLYLQIVQLRQPRLVSTRCWVQVAPLPIEPGDDRQIQKERRIETRQPDLTLMREEHLDIPRDRSACITLDMLPPDLVVEVVSPGTRNRRRDYDVKLKQYCDRGIPEYWVVDPDRETVTIHKLVATEEGGKIYHPVVFTQDAELMSDVLPAFRAIASEILAA